jgi:VWFA-related protein
MFKKNLAPIFLKLSAPCLTLFLFSQPAVQFSSKKQPPDHDQTSSATTIKIAVTLVSVNAKVTDKHGNPIKDLHENEFQIFEDGAPQRISVFRAISSPEPTAATTSTSNTIPSANRMGTLPQKVILFVDDYHLKMDSLERVKSAGENFIHQRLAPSDLLALVTVSGKISGDFTRDHNLIIAKLRQIVPTAAVRRPSSDCPPLTDYQAYLISDKEESAGEPYSAAVADTIQCLRLEGAAHADEIAGAIVKGTARARAFEITDDSRRTLFALQHLARQLRVVEGQKVLILLSDGMLAGNINPQVEDAIDAIVRSNTIIQSVNATGIEATPPGGEAAFSGMVSPGTVVARDKIQGDSRWAVEEVLYALADATGGMLFHNNNDLFRLMNWALDRTQGNYFLGYYSTNPERDGKFRKIVVKVDRPDVKVESRKGYYASKSDESAAGGMDEEISDALRYPGMITEIPVSVSYTIHHGHSVGPVVAIQTQIDIRPIHFQKVADRNRNIIMVMSAVYDSSDHLLLGKKNQVNLYLTDQNYSKVLQNGFSTLTKFDLKPGTYTVKTVVHEAEGDKLTSTTKRLEITD